MRLTENQKKTICETVSGVLGPSARVLVFGSRLNDQGRGGDLDLLVEYYEKPTLIQRAQIKMALESALSIPVDVVGKKKDDEPNAFQRIAFSNGIPLGDH